MITGSEMLTGSVAHAPLAFPHCWMPNFHSIGCKMHIPLMAGRFHNNPTASNCHCLLLSHVQLEVQKSLWENSTTGTTPFPSAHDPRPPIPNVFNIFHRKEGCPKVKAITVQRNFLNHCTSAQSLFQRFRPGRLAGQRINWNQGERSWLGCWLCQTHASKCILYYNMQSWSFLCHVMCI